MSSGVDRHVNACRVQPTLGSVGKETEVHTQTVQLEELIVAK
jgi:hypothetical protein